MLTVSGFLSAIAGWTAYYMLDVTLPPWVTRKYKFNYRRQMGGLANMSLALIFACTGLSTTSWKVSEKDYGPSKNDKFGLVRAIINNTDFWVADPILPSYIPVASSFALTFTFLGIVLCVLCLLFSGFVMLHMMDRKGHRYAARFGLFGSLSFFFAVIFYGSIWPLDPDQDEFTFGSSFVFVNLAAVMSLASGILFIKTEFARSPAPRGWILPSSSAKKSDDEEDDEEVPGEEVALTSPEKKRRLPSKKKNSDSTHSKNSKSSKRSKQKRKNQASISGNSTDSKKRKKSSKKRKKKRKSNVSDTDTDQDSQENSDMV